MAAITPTLSIDIGIRHLGYSILTEDGLTFGLFDIVDAYKSDPELKAVKHVAVQRAWVLNRFLSRLIKEHKIKQVIVERQVQTNTVAMELVHTIVGICVAWIPKIIIFDPKKKFTMMHVKYSTKNKAHKKLAVSMCREALEKLYPDLVTDFDQHDKQDDIADSILMNLLVNRVIGIRDNNKLPLENVPKRLKTPIVQRTLIEDTRE